jgi:hypothetical protein
MPQLRGRLLAHADLRHPREAAAVRAFLANPRREPEAVQFFVMYFPNDTETLRLGLFEPGHLPLAEETLKSYASALEVVRGWRRDPAMSGSAEALSIMELKLADLVGNQVRAED